jgi:AraC-like DNA-binding protein
MQCERLRKLGFTLFFKWEMSDGFISLPASNFIRVNYIMEGFSYYKGTTLNTGDIVVSGLTSGPMFGYVSNIAMVTFEVDFPLFYQLTGILPSSCSTPLILKKHDTGYQMLVNLFEIPFAGLENHIMLQLQKKYTRTGKTYEKQLDRMKFAMEYYRCHPWSSFHEISEKMGITYRQLQRDFSGAIGITPSEYARTLRFHNAAAYLKKMSLVDTALHAGYCDQAHMIREFKIMSGRTPMQIKELGDLELPQKHPYII